VDVRANDGPASEVTVIGQGARMEGDVVSAGSLRIDGHVKGTITADGDVTLTPSSQVDAEIHAQSVLVAGRFRGNIVAKGRAELARGGRVDGNVSCSTLVVAEGAIFSGQSIMGQEAADGRTPSSEGRAGQAHPQAVADGQAEARPAQA
jgi:cytoskeletal protein CcmA (bactofilin family)